MKAKTMFMKMFYKLPVEARRELIYGYPDNIMSLEVCSSEVFINYKKEKRLKNEGV